MVLSRKFFRRKPINPMDACAHDCCSRSFLGLPTSYICSERQLRYSHNEFGTHPRALAHHASDPSSYEADVIIQVRSMNPKALTSCEDPSHLIVAIKPSRPSRVEDHCITAYIRDALEPTRRKPNFQEGRFLVVQVEEDRPAIRYSNMDIFDINYFINTGEILMDFHLPISDGHGLEERAGLRVGHYHHPRSTTSLQLTPLSLFTPTPSEPPHTPLTFQVTGNRAAYNVNTAGLYRIVQLQLRKGGCKYCVAVTSSDTKPVVEIPMRIPQVVTR